MKIVSMAYTTPSVIARAKTVTRRNWKPTYAKQFHEGDFIEAWSKSPRNGGKPIALLRLTADPVFEPIRTEGLTEEENVAEILRLWNEEGFRYLDNDAEDLLGLARQWHETGRRYWTIRFEVLSIISKNEKRFTTPKEIQRCRLALLDFIARECDE